MLSIRSLRPLLCGFLFLSLASAPSQALTQAEVHRLAAAIEASGDDQALQDFQTLKEAGILEVTAPTEDPSAELAFRVLDANQDPVTQAFRRIKQAGYLNALKEPGIPADLRRTLQAVNQDVRTALSEMDKIPGLVSEYNASWFTGRLKARKKMKIAIETAAHFVSRAADRFAPIKNRTDPEVEKVRSVLKQTLRLVQQQVSWFNRTFAD